MSVSERLLWPRTKFCEFRKQSDDPTTSTPGAIGYSLAARVCVLVQVAVSALATVPAILYVGAQAVKSDGDVPFAKKHLSEHLSSLSIGIPYSILPLDHAALAGKVRRATRKSFQAKTILQAYAWSAKARGLHIAQAIVSLVITPFAFVNMFFQILVGPDFERNYAIRQFHSAKTRIFDSLISVLVPLNPRYKYSAHKSRLAAPAAARAVRAGDAAPVSVVCDDRSGELAAVQVSGAHGHGHGHAHSAAAADSAEPASSEGPTAIAVSH